MSCTIMFDVDKQVDYWRRGADEDWEVAAKLVGDGRRRRRHGLFFAHLALEKMLKALVCRRTHDVPPRIHNLIRLGKLAGLEPDSDQIDLLVVSATFDRAFSREAVNCLWRVAARTDSRIEPIP